MSIIEEIDKKLIDTEVQPHVMTRLMAITQKEDHSVRDVVSIIEVDPSLTARVLRVANSAAYSRRKSITSLHRAIVHLGERMVIGIAIGACLSKMYNPPLDGYAAASGELWDHSLRTAIASRLLANHCYNEVSGDLAFTCGLIHDIGKSIISEYLVGHAEKAREWFETGRVSSFLEAEREIINTDHAEIGSIIASRWDLPEPLVEAIKHHHKPSEADVKYKNLVYVVHLGDIFAMLGGTGTGADTLAYELDEEYNQYISINKHDFSRLLLAVQEEFLEIQNNVFAEEDHIA